MNFLPNLKIEQICNELNDIEFRVLKNCVELDDTQIRILIDSRRHLLARLTREVEAQEPGQNISKFYAQQPNVKQFIYTWCDQIKTKKDQNISFECPDFCNLLLDHILPKMWNFDEDLIVIHKPKSPTILEIAQLRNQKHTIIYSPPGEVTLDVAKFANLHRIRICFTPEHLQRTVSILQINAHQTISISCDSNPANAQSAKVDILNAVERGKRIQKENSVTTSNFGERWATNVLKNIASFKKFKNLHQLEVTGVDDAIIVASGPSLNKNVNQLRAIQDSVFIISALRSLPVLNAAGVEADLIIQLDAESDEVAQKLSPDHSKPVKNLLLEGSVNNGFLGIPAQNIIWSLPQHYFDIHQKFGTKPTPFNVPSVSIYGLCLAQFLNFKNICFIGQDLAASHNQQYADGATSLLPAHSGMSSFKTEVPGFFGDTVLTKSSLQFQIGRCSEIAQKWQAEKLEMNLVNATEGGAYIQGFDHTTLEAFIEQRKIRSRQTKKSINFLAGFDTNSSATETYLQEFRDTMLRISRIADAIIKLDSQSEKTRGLDKKIKKMIQKFQSLNDTTSLLQIAMQDDIHKVVGTSRTVETVDTYAQFFQKVKGTALTLRDITKH
ncbi:DUF115 domain-containing protein [Alphaproteobacteria bacterium]|nr:DUF115 domain-containing protein [Alphaproteobacteria bacterium]